MPPRAFLCLAVLLAACGKPVGSSSDGGGGGGAGGGGGSDAGTTDGGANWCTDVRPIVEARCQSCHGATPSFGAPYSLVTHADTQKPGAGGQPVHARMAARIAQDVSPMPQAPNPKLSAAEIALFQSWSAAGGPEGDASKCTGGGADGGTDAGNIPPPAPCPAGSEEVVATAPAFQVPMKADHYQCFAQTVVTGGKRHAFRIDRVLGDTRVLHHIVLFRDLGKNSPASIPDCNIQSDWQVLYAWAPGTGPLDTPADIGLGINDGDQIVIQLHYHNPQNLTSTDSSGARICMTSQLRPREASVLAVGPTQFSLPPKCAKVSVQSDCLNITGTTYEVFTAWPHMHVRGRSLITTQHRAGQLVKVVTDRPSFSFESQYLEPASAQFRPQDSLRTRCTWDTSADNTAIGFGEGTQEEMCFNFLYITPPPPVSWCPGQASQPTCQ